MLMVMKFTVLNVTLRIIVCKLLVLYLLFSVCFARIKQP